MKTLHIYEGFEIPTDEGYRKVTGKHFGDFAVDDYAVDEEGKEKKIGSAILRDSEIKSAMHQATGESFDRIVYDGNEDEEEEEEE